MKRLSTIMLLSLIILSAAGPDDVSAQYNHWYPRWDQWYNMNRIEPKGYVCYRADIPVTIDGKLDDEAWRLIPWTDNFVDIEGDVKTAPRMRTQVKMVWDDTYFYVAADMEDRHVWATLTNHDDIIYLDNDFEIFIDPDADNHMYYELEINALNTVWDLMLNIPYRDGGERIMDWSVPGLKTAVTVNGTLNDPSDNDRGWSVEFAIPWDVLAEYANRPSPPREGDQWRVNFSRVEYQPEVQLADNVRLRGETRTDKDKGTRGENWVWSPQGVINMHCPEMWGYVQFTYGKPNTVAFRPNPEQPIRSILHGIYYTQYDFRDRHDRWASSLDELALYNINHEYLAEPPAITLTPDGFIVTAKAIMPGGRTATMSIAQDSKVTVVYQ